MVLHRPIETTHVIGEDSFDEAVAIAPYVDALLDSGNPTLAIKELGGTGRVHDWEVSRRIREKIDRLIFLAGGLRPDNVGEAIRRVGPFGLDLCNGVRTTGNSMQRSWRSFFRKLRARKFRLRSSLQRIESYSLPKKA